MTGWRDRDDEVMMVLPRRRDLQAKVWRMMGEKRTTARSSSTSLSFHCSSSPSYPFLSRPYYAYRRRLSSIHDAGRWTADALQSDQQDLVIVCLGPERHLAFASLSDAAAYGAACPYRQSGFVIIDRSRQLLSPQTRMSCPSLKYSHLKHVCEIRYTAMTVLVTPHGPDVLLSRDRFIATTDASAIRALAHGWGVQLADHATDSIVIVDLCFILAVSFLVAEVFRRSQNEMKHSDAREPRSAADHDPQQTTEPQLCVAAWRP